jgi:hypothetical protein
VSAASRSWRPLGLAAAVVAAAAALALPAALSAPAHRLSGILALTVVLWLTEAIPLMVRTGLVVDALGAAIVWAAVRWLGPLAASGGLGAP